MMWDGGDSGIITLSPSRKTVFIVLLFTVVALATQILPAHAVNYAISFNNTTITAQAGYYVLLSTSCGAPASASFTISGAHFTYNAGTGNFEAHVTSGVMAVTTPIASRTTTPPSVNHFRAAPVGLTPQRRTELMSAGSG